MNKLLLLIIVLSLTACQKEKIKEIKLFQSEEKKEILKTEKSIKIGIAAIVSAKEGFVYYKDLLDYLSKKISLPLIIKYGNYNEINQSLRKGEVDMAFICSGAYIERDKKFGLDLLVIPVINGKTTYHSYIIVHKESNISNFNQLKGKSFAFTDPLSNSGYLYPVFILSQKKEFPERFFSKIIFTYSHDNSIIAVAEKLIDGAAVDSLVYDWLKQTNPDLISRTKIILISPPFENPPVVVSKSLEYNLKKKLEKFFLELHKDEKGKEILNKLRIDKFVKSDVSKYNSIRLMKEKIENLKW